MVGLFAEYREIIAAMDFFTVLTVTFCVLYCFFVIEHERRKILQCDATSLRRNGLCSNYGRHFRSRAATSK
jgi:hypothetical protein